MADLAERVTAGVLNCLHLFPFWVAWSNKELVHLQGACQILEIKDMEMFRDSETIGFKVLAIYSKSIIIFKERKAVERTSLYEEEGDREVLDGKRNKG